MTPARTETTHHAGDERPDGSALLIIDMISAWDFEDGAALARQALAIAPRIRRLAERCRDRGAPVIYANDNRGRWRSDLRELVEHSMAAGAAGARITALLAPTECDYFVLKPRHSAFFATPLALLLQDLGTRHLVLAGVSADQCVLHSAADARMHGQRVTVPRDTVATPSAERTKRALRHFGEALCVPTPASARVRL